MASLKFKFKSIKQRTEIKDDIQTPSEIYQKNQKLSYALMSSI